jgi:hypothetical protein
MSLAVSVVSVVILWLRSLVEYPCKYISAISKFYECFSESISFEYWLFPNVDVIVIGGAKARAWPCPQPSSSPTGTHVSTFVFLSLWTYRTLKDGSEVGLLKDEASFSTRPILGRNEAGARMCEFLKRTEAGLNQENGTLRAECLASSSVD